MRLFFYLFVSSSCNLIVLLTVTVILLHQRPVFIHRFFPTLFIELFFVMIVKTNPLSMLVLFTWRWSEKEGIKRHHPKNDFISVHVTNRGVSRRLSRRQRLKIFNFFCLSAAAAKKLLGNRRRRLENFNFFLSVGGGGWKLFVVGGGGWKFFGSRRQRLKFFTDLLKTILNFEKFSHKKSKEW